MKSEAIVGPPTTSNIPSILTRHKLAWSSLVEIKTEEEVQLDVVPKTLEQVTSSQTTDAQSPPEQNDHCHIQTDEEVPRNQKERSTDTMRNKQLVLASFFEYTPLQELSLIHPLAGVPAGPSAGLLRLSLDTTIAVAMKRATDLYGFDISPSYVLEIQHLDGQTGALVLYRPNPHRRSQYHLLQAVEDLSEHSEPFEASSFEEEYHIEDSTDIVLDSSCVICPNETSHSLGLPEELPNIEDSGLNEVSCVYRSVSFDEELVPIPPPDVPATDDLNREILRLKAQHRIEVERLKVQNRENLQICADDVADQKQKTINANNRAARSVRQLNASRKERQKLGEREPVDSLHARIAELEAQLAKERSESDYLLDEGLKLQQTVQEQQETIEILEAEQARFQGFRKERDQLLTRCQQLIRDEVNPRQDLIDSMEAQIKGLNHQMRQSVKGYQDMYANFVDVSERLERQKVLNKALCEQRVTKFIERPLSREDWNVLRPDELIDAQQALLVSQDSHRKAVKHSEELVKEVESKDQLLEFVTEQVRNAQNKVKALRSCRALTTDVRRAHENSFIAFAAEDASEGSPELKAAAREVIAKEQAMTQRMVDLAMENVKSEKTIATMKRHHAKELAAKEVEHAALLRKVSDVDVEAFNNEIKVVNLCEQVDGLTTQLERGEEQLGISNEVANEYRAQLEYRAYGGDYDVVIRALKGELSKANDTIDSQHEDIIQQQYHIDELHANIGQFNLMIDRTRPFRLWRIRYHHDEAIIGAFRDRFAQELAAKPLEVDYKGLTIPAETDEEKADLDFDEYEWMTVH